MNTVEAIEQLAAAFCKLSQPEHRSLYLVALEALVRLSKAEKSHELLADLDAHPELRALLYFHLGSVGNATRQ